jgi:hypothetical protein
MDRGRVLLESRRCVVRDLALISDIKAALAEVRKVIGEVPILASEQVRS